LNCGIFVRDMNVVFERLSGGLESGLRVRLESLKNRLVRLYRNGKVKINHSVVELVLAKHLLEAGYEVDVERCLNGLSCDVYAVRDERILIVEVETGFIPLIV